MCMSSEHPDDGNSPHGQHDMALALSQLEARLTRLEESHGFTEHESAELGRQVLTLQRQFAALTASLRDIESRLGRVSGLLERSEPGHGGPSASEID